MGIRDKMVPILSALTLGSEKVHGEKQRGAGDEEVAAI